MSPPVPASTDSLTAQEPQSIETLSADLKQPMMRQASAPPDVGAVSAVQPGVIDSSSALVSDLLNVMNSGHSGSSSGSSEHGKNHSEPVAICLPKERDLQLSGRSKELTIREVIYKVGLWRQLWSGVIEGDTRRRYSLDEAAKKVRVSRKTLDDYLLQIRLGKKYGFDFRHNQGALIGTLRRYVKKQRCVENIKQPQQ